MERPNGRDNEITRWTNEIPTIWRAIKSVDKPDDKIEPSWKIGRNLFSIPSPPPRRSKTIFDAVFRRFRPTIRCRERVLPASKHNPDFFPPSLAAKFFPGKTRFPFQMTARQVPHTARVLFARVNGRKLPKIAGNGCAGVAPPDEHHERRGRRWADGRTDGRNSFHLRHFRRDPKLYRHRTMLRCVNDTVLSTLHVIFTASSIVDESISNRNEHVSYDIINLSCRSSFKL